MFKLLFVFNSKTVLKISVNYATGCMPNFLFKKVCPNSLHIQTCIEHFLCQQIQKTHYMCQHLSRAETKAPVAQNESQ